MRVTLLRADDGEVLMEALRVCKNKVVTVDTIRRAILAGHESVLEHIVYSFKIEGISRVCLAQLTRHRMASHSVSSQRSINQADAEFYVPDEVVGAARTHMKNHYERSLQEYHWLLNHGVSKEDARYVLPESTEVDLVMTINLRSLRNFLRLRLDKHAQAEIRELANAMLNLIPTLYTEDIVAPRELPAGEAGQSLVVGENDQPTWVRMPEVYVPRESLEGGMFLGGNL